MQRWSYWWVAILVSGIIGGAVAGRQLCYQTVMNGRDWQERIFSQAGCSLRLPADWYWEIIELDGEEITRQVVFLNPQCGVEGYLQVWSISDLDKFLTESRDTSGTLFKTYCQTPLHQGSVRGLRLSYQQMAGDRLLETEELWLWYHTNKTRRRRIVLFNQSTEQEDRWKKKAEAILNSATLIPSKTNE